MNAQNTIQRPVILVGLMGAGKTSVGRKLATLLDFSFVDADHEIEEAAGCTIEDFFEMHGEAEFRKGEEKVIRRLLESGNQVLATGGGAFMNSSIREAIAEHGISVWLRADLDILSKRTGRRGGRPLLSGPNPEQVLQKLMDERYPTYAKADIVVDTSQESIDLTANNILESLTEFVQNNKHQT
jgi:shikimate kinase